MGKTLYFGGPILTMLRERPFASSVLVEDGVILGPGTPAGDADLCDLHGRTLMPAFVDGHSHLASFGLFLAQCDLTGCRDHAELLQRIRTFRATHGLYHGEPIRCRGYDPELLAEGRHPTAKLLDSLGFDNPIVCTHRSGHGSAYNTAAMRLCGVDDDYLPPPGGKAERDSDGHLTGYFEETANRPLRRLFSEVTREQRTDAILKAEARYLSHGITTIQDGSAGSIEDLALYDALSRENRLTADVVGYLSASADEKTWQEALLRFGNRLPRGRFRLGGAKMFLDGSPQLRTAWMQAPYEAETDYRGYPRMSDDAAEEIALRAARYGVQLLAHCNGDAACGQFVSAWEKAVAAFPEAKHLRPVMIHAQTVTDDQLRRMVKIGMMPSFFVGHLWYWGDTHLRNLGKARASRISPASRALGLGLPYSFHQDAPVTEPDMLHSVWCAVNRMTESGRVLSPDDRLGVYDALIGATRGGAYGYFEEARLGVLAPGAAADLVILDRDPTNVDPMQIRDISVLQTIKNGETVYTR